MTKKEFFEAFRRREYGVRLSSKEEHDAFVHDSPFLHPYGWDETFPIMVISDEGDHLNGYRNNCDSFDMGVKYLISYADYVNMTSQPEPEIEFANIDLESVL